MQNDLNKAAGEAAPKAKTHKAHPHDALSFRRLATEDEMKAGSDAFMMWGVEPSGHQGHDREVGEAIAEEAAEFLIKHDRYADRYIVSQMLRDMMRHADREHRFIIAGFGTRLAELAAMGLLFMKPFAEWPQSMRDAIEIQKDDAATTEAPASVELPVHDNPISALESEVWDLKSSARCTDILTTDMLESLGPDNGVRSGILQDEIEAVIWQVGETRRRADEFHGRFQGAMKAAGLLA